MKLNQCKYCGSFPYSDWCNGDDSYKVECGMALQCKYWPRIYANTKTKAIELWNLCMDDSTKETPASEE